MVAVDGHAVNPASGSCFPLAIASTPDIALDLPVPGSSDSAHVEGRRARTGIILATAEAPIARIADATTCAALGNPLEARPQRSIRRRRVRWISSTGSRFGRHAALFVGAERQYWPEIKPLMLRKRQRVEIELINQTAMPHLCICTATPSR